MSFRLSGVLSPRTGRVSRILLRFPVVLGTGRRLFDGGVVPAAFRPVGTLTTGSGVVVHRYEPVGEVAHGSFALE